MNQIQYQRYYFLPIFMIFNSITTLIAQPNSSFSLKSFQNDKDHNFNSNFTLLGDAHISNNGNLINLTSNSSFGSIIYKKPIKFSNQNLSFFTDFTFTITPGDGDGIAFVIFPKVNELSNVFGEGYFGLLDNVGNNFVAVEYDTRKDDNVGDLNGNHIGVDVGSFESVEISNVSSIGLNLNNGISLTSWIDYVSKRLEIRLAKSSSKRPENPLISYPIDLSKMWGDKDVIVGISGSSRWNSSLNSSQNSSQVSSLSAWSFMMSTGSSLYHSDSLNPEMIRKKSKFLSVLGGVIFATGCGTMLAFFGLFIWVIVYGRHSIVVSELGMNPLDCKYEKVNVTVDNVDNVDNVVDDPDRSSTG